jgi:NADPH:quinone reductase-like Zn-dependent oxidoreductase
VSWFMLELLELALHSTSLLVTLAGRNFLKTLTVMSISYYRNSGTVITTASTTEKLDWLASMKEGPTHIINYKTQDFAKECESITDGKGVNLIVDFVGKTHWEKNIASLAVDGRMVILSFLSGKSSIISFYFISY